jgi:hypothetical protein
MQIGPWAHTGHDEAAMEQSLQDFVGKIVVNMTYRYPEGYYFFPEEFQAGFDEARIAIHIDFSDGTSAQFRWMMDDLLEGIVIQLAETAQDLEGEALPLTRRPSDSLLKLVRSSNSVSQMIPVWQTSSPTETRSLMAVKLEFGTGSQIAIALGHGEETAGISYIPDTLVCIYDPDLAQEYFAREYL